MAFSLFVALLAWLYSSAPTPVQPNDNRRAAGKLEQGILTLRLEVKQGALFPESDGGSSVPVLAFAEAGRPPQVPGPLIRVPKGTEVRVSIQNPFRDSALTVYGLREPTSTPDSGIRIPPGEAHEVRFRARNAGTYFYWATTGGRDLESREWWESQLSGALIVDAPNAPTNDRVFVIGMWFDAGDSTATPRRAAQDVMVINGRSWPHTERLTLAQGDSVRWRWINATVSAHPMHLHGFYFTVESRGDWNADRELPAAARPLAVTQLLLPGETMRMSWLPERSGNWVFHCHFAFHVSHHLALKDTASTSHDGHSGAHKMAGLVLGLNVTPSSVARNDSGSSGRAREIRLLAQSKPRQWGKLTGFGYVVQTGPREPARDSIEVPGPLLLLRRGEPVRITVVNHLAEPTAVHWHGIELESFPDGVPNWSGQPGRIMPPIAPADSFVAEFVPPRAGTFIYHTHSNEQLQMGAGLYGPLLVVDERHPYDTVTNKLIVVGGAGPADSMPNLESPGLVNGFLAPPPMVLQAGKTYRLRMININPDWRVIFSLMSDARLQSWRVVAKDGADVPRARQNDVPAWLLTGPGETADVEITPRTRGELRLEVKTMVSGWIIPVRVIVR